MFTLCLIASILLAWPVFLPSHRAKFLFADLNVMIAAVKYAADPRFLTLRRLRRDRRYLPYMTLAWSTRLFGDRAAYYHLTDCIIHAWNAWLVYSIAGYWFPDVRAFLIMAVFLVHPLNMYSTCYISARFGAMCAAFLLATVWLLLYGPAWLSILSLLLAYKCKEDWTVIFIWLPLLVLFR